MAQGTKVVKTVAQLRKTVAAWRSGGETVALVPTMGALHEGHLSLVKLAGSHAKRVIVSIFINPAQFAPGEDLENYPRNIKDDVEKLSRLETDLVFMPDRDEIYPPGHATKIIVSGVSQGLCATSRPHFFSGVATVVAKLLIQCLPDIAVFGEKDYQQLLVIKRMVRDLDIPVNIISGPLIREADGLAMSSRNVYLSPEERQIAPRLFETLRDMALGIAGGQSVDQAIDEGLHRLGVSGFRVDYLEARDTNTLALLTADQSSNIRLFAAAYLGNTRLIDNMPVEDAVR